MKGKPLIEWRILRNAALYGAIGALSAAQAWPEDAAVTWRFWVAIGLGALVAMKALYSRGAESEVRESVDAPAASAPSRAKAGGPP